MEILAILGLSPQFLISFCMYGILANIVIGVLRSVIISAKFTTYTPEEKQTYLMFLQSRFAYAKQYNKAYVRFLNFFSFLIPTYTAWLNTVFLWTFLHDTTLNGMMMGLKRYDEFSIFQTVKYKVSTENK